MSQDGHSRRGVAELRAGSHSKAWGTAFFESLRKENFRWADLVQRT
jgi:hypothetical protein